MHRSFISLAIGLCSACGEAPRDAATEALLGRANLIRRVATPSASASLTATTTLTSDHAIAVRFDELPGRDPLRAEVVVHRESGEDPVVFRAWSKHPRLTALVRTPLGESESRGAEDVRIDVTSFVREAISRGETTTSMWIDASDDVTIAGPANVHRERRPRLDLYTL